MKILITGGSGYIGSILTSSLLKNNYDVTVIDNLLYRQNSHLDHCYLSNFSFVYGDCRDKNLMKSLIKDKDIIIPLAALVGAPLCESNKMDAISTNRDAIIMLNSIRSKDQLVLFPTTNSGYGIGQNNIFCTEETPLNPVSLYGKTKVEAEKELLNSENIITLRFATVFGLSPRMRLDLLVNDFTYKAFHDRFIVLFEASFKRNYIHIRDAANAFCFCISNFSKMKNEPYNVGLSSANLSKLELCNIIKSFFPDFYITESPINKDPDQRNYIVSNEKIERHGFRCEFSINAGIMELKKGFEIMRNNYYRNF